MTELTNVLQIVGLVVARLTETIGDECTVEKMADFAEIEFSEWPSPAVYVIPGALSTDSTVGDFISLGLDVHAVVVVDNASAVQGSGGPDAQAGTLALAVIRALHNWYPGETYDTLVMKESPGSLDFAPGRLLFPLTFSTTTTVEGFFDPNH